MNIQIFLIFTTTGSKVQNELSIGQQFQPLSKEAVKTSILIVLQQVPVFLKGFDWLDLTDFTSLIRSEVV